MNIKIFKIVDGQDIVAQFRSYSLEGYNLYFPLVITSELDEVGDFSLVYDLWIPYGANQKIHLNKLAVMAVIDADADIVKQYFAAIKDFKSDELEVEFEPETESTLYLEDDKDVTYIHPGFRKPMSKHKM